MGVCSYIYAACPKCSESIQFLITSIVPECSLFTIDEVPLQVAVETDGETTYCENCNCRVMITSPIKMHSIRMLLQALDDDDDNG